MRLSCPNPSTTLLILAPVLTQILAISLINEMRVAKKAFEAYLTSSALLLSINIISPKQLYQFTTLLTSDFILCEKLDWTDSLWKLVTLINVMVDQSLIEIDYKEITDFIKMYFTQKGKILKTGRINEAYNRVKHDREDAYKKFKKEMCITIKY